MSVLDFFVLIKILVKLNSEVFNIFFCFVVNFCGKTKVTILNIVLFKRIVKGGFHAVACDKKA